MNTGILFLSLDDSLNSCNQYIKQADTGLENIPKDHYSVIYYTTYILDKCMSFYMVYSVYDFLSKSSMKKAWY